MNGMIAMRTIIYFLVTSLLSAIIGLILVLLIHPGNPETKAELGNGNTEARQVDIVDNFMDLGRNLFPDNMFKASFQTVTTVKVFLVGPFVGHGGTEGTRGSEGLGGLQVSQGSEGLEGLEGHKGSQGQGGTEGP